MKGEWKSQSSLAQKIREIVDEEYDSNQISLEYVGSKVHKNSAYISKIFKNEFGCNFSDYIITKRLEKKARSFLRILQGRSMKFPRKWLGRCIQLY